MFDPQDIGEIQNKLDRIVYNTENGLNITMHWTIEQCVEFVANWHYCFMEEPHSEDALNYMDAFINYFAGFVQNYLEEEGIDWQDNL